MRDHKPLNVDLCKMDTMSLERLQLAKLQRLLQYIKKKSRFYKYKFSKSNDLRSKISKLDDVQSFPFTTKEEILAHEKYDNLCVSLDDVVEVHFSSGTTGMPLASFYTLEDLRRSRNAIASTWKMQGVDRDSVVAMLVSYGLFSAGMLNHSALKNLGAFVIPISNAHTQKALNYMRAFHANTAVAVASHYTYLTEVMKNIDFNPRTLSLKTIIGGGEPISESKRIFIENFFGATYYNQYGLCEIDTGIAGECKYNDGLHILGHYVYPEVVNTVTGELVGEGEEGELVLTTLDKIASPLFRYKTGDIVRLTHERCKCGRTSPRISAPRRNNDSTIYYKGIKIELLHIKKFMYANHSIVNPYLWRLECSGDTLHQRLNLFIIPKENQNIQSVKCIADDFKNKFDLTINVKKISPEKLERWGHNKWKYFNDSRKK